MATPLSPSRLVEILRAEGLTVHEVRSWRTHNRNSKGPWGPVNGVMIHHTVTSGTQASVDLCYDGYSSLPGPLCHGVIDKKGHVHLVGNGRANHAGSGDSDVLAAVVDERALPADNETDTDGNRHFYGFECINLGNGKDPWPEAQLLAIEKVSAAICRHHGWQEESVIGHLEWQPGKVDPRGFTMTSMRGRIRARLGKKPTPGGGTGSGSPSGVAYTVRKGDTLWSIGRAHGVTVAAIVDANRLADPGQISVGQKLNIPGAKTTTYTVARGDTLWSIAASKLGDGNRWRQIATLNRLNDADDLSVGQKLTLPKK
ncbi:LysM peptidoglycan-binding domain-containing protein [Streptomyces afghaniensis]|uniref:LysM peptidoglycan-binding domain-containing protein n=1 Tax=Streptomyces afghaniensis TaxID=66865 RepID=UPI0033B35972